VAAPSPTNVPVIGNVSRLSVMVSWPLAIVAGTRTTSARLPRSHVGSSTRSIAPSAMGALSWALGYISCAQEAIANQANKEQDIERFDPLAAKSKEGALWFVRAITERCLKRPNEPFVNAIKCSWQKWLDVPPKGLCG
jgi:hypothetical protein